MKEILKQYTLKIISKIVITSTLVWVYAAIIIGTIIPMLFMVPLGFISWEMFRIFNPHNWIRCWLILNYRVDYPGVITFIVFEFLLFAFGLGLFIWGLIYIARTKIKKEGLTTRGPYRFIRHPQHMGIILMSFSVSLFVPWTTDLGIRVGEVLSWSLFSLILILWAYYEEWKLTKRFGEKYIHYRSETGAFFPKIFTRNKKLWYSQEIRHWKRVLFTIIGYICYILLMYLFVYALFKAGILKHTY